ncbi:odorant receptor 10-like [Diabrotica undecimpunctata]|uniref:odorant receptor 10-like n=1 Tax=Diabrotica undecimpunctata TaxID=50387 RepID=UPI003B638353
MKLSMYANAVFGIWPFIFEDYPTLKKIYDVYCKITLTYYFLFIVSGWIKFFQLFQEIPIPATEIMGNISITFIYSVTIWRARAIRGPRMMNIIKNVIDWEKKIMDSEDQPLIDIFNNYAWQNRIISQVFIITVIIVTNLFFVHPLGLDPRERYDPVTNETVYIRPLPLSSWFPFDDQKHYLRAYMFHILDAYVGASFVNNTDLFSFGIITFPLGQTVILNYILSHFEDYVVKIQEQLGVDRDEASFITLRECILKHKDIISYIHAFNKEMNIVILLDFLQSSLQLAAIVLQLIFFEVNLFNFVFSIMFVICMLTRLLGYYWYANEIIIETSNIPLAIWSSKWYEEPKKTQDMMMIMMLKCSRPLALNIGPFNTMSINTLIGIIKATYSYMMVVYKGQQSK